MRVEKSGIRYFGFNELPTSSNPEKKKVSKDKQEKFLGKCKVCNQQLVYISGTNIISCQNPACKGFKHTRKDKEGNDVTFYTPVYRVLNDKNAEYAEYLFEEE